MQTSRRRLTLAVALTCLLSAVAAVSPAFGDDPPAEPVQVQILATNDFHGRIANDPFSSAAGAAAMAGAVKQLRSANPNTVFTAAGDLIGASTFESFIDQDKPTIDALNEAGLEVSAAGNHEFDQGYADLVNRVMAPESPSNPKGGAEWKYIAANVRFKADDSPALDGTWIKTMSGVDVGFVGAVTEDLPSLVTPSGIAQIKVTDIVAETNAAAADLKTAGADVVVLLVHEGAPGSNCAAIEADTTSKFGKIVAGVSDNVDAIVSGHTHLEYNCSLPVPGWSTRPVKERPVVSAGQYGANLNQIVYAVDSATGQVQSKSQAVLKLKAANGGPFNFPVDAATQSIVTAALANSDVLGAAPLGQIGGAFNRAKLANGTTENRGGESTLGNLVAEVHRWATSAPESGAAQIAFMNPGGLRADMTGTGAGAFPRTLSYKQAATVQPFANTLVNMQLTGAEIKTALEQQWQPTGASRPFLRLGVSKGFRYTFDASKPEGSRITGMWLDGTPVTPSATYSVTVNSFLAAGGDNFPAFAGGTGKRDTGKADLQAMVDYMAAQTDGTNPPLPVDFSQRSVGVRFPAGAPAAYRPGNAVSFDLSSLSMTTADDVKDTSVSVKLGSQTLGTFPVTTAVQTALPGFDETGTASVTVTLPAGTPAGARDLIIEGTSTGTTTTVPITVAPTPVVVAPATTVAWGAAGTANVTVTGNAGAPTGKVEVFDGATKLGEAPVGGTGTADVPLPALSVTPGVKTLTAAYSGDGTYDPVSATFALTVQRAATTVTAPDAAATAGSNAAVEVAVSAPGGLTPGGTVVVRRGETTLGSATLVNGKAVVTLATSGLAAGTYPLTAVYPGSAFFFSSGQSLALTLTRVPEPPVTPPGLTPPPIVLLPGTGSGAPATPVTTACVGTRTFTATLRAGKGQRLVSGTLTFRGKTTRLRKRGANLVATVDVRGLKPGTYTATLSGRTSTGRKVVRRVTYRVCPGRA